MSGNRGCLGNSCLFLIIVSLPIVGQIVTSVMAFDDEHGCLGTTAWLVVIWLAPTLGPLLYLFFGQRSPRYGRVLFNQPSYSAGTNIPTR